jgi:iron uptake system EfeUOB component EfeO/EfeM
VEDVDLEVIRRVAQQFEAAVAQQTKTVVAKAAPTKTVTDRQQLQCSYCNIKGHNITTCYKKSNADSGQTTTTSNNNTSTNNYSNINKSSNNNTSTNTTTTRSSTPNTTSNTTSTTFRDYQCYTCGQTGHRRRNCPNRK